MPIVEKRDDQSVDHFGRSTIRRQHAAPKEADRGENSEPGETRPKRLCLTPAIRELQWGRINALRSERYSLNKMAIERGVFGDNITGLLKEDTEKPLIEISSEKITKSDDQQ